MTNKLNINNTPLTERLNKTKPEPKEGKLEKIELISTRVPKSVKLKIKMLALQNETTMETLLNEGINYIINKYK